MGPPTPAECLCGFNKMNIFVLWFFFDDLIPKSIACSSAPRPQALSKHGDVGDLRSLRLKPCTRVYSTAIANRTLHWFVLHQSYLTHRIYQNSCRILLTESLCIDMMHLKGFWVSPYTTYTSVCFNIRRSWHWLLKPSSSFALHFEISVPR